MKNDNSRPDRCLSRLLRMSSCVNCPRNTSQAANDGLSSLASNFTGKRIRREHQGCGDGQLGRNCEGASRPARSG